MPLAEKLLLIVVAFASVTLASGSFQPAQCFQSGVALSRPVLTAARHSRSPAPIAVLPSAAAWLPSCTWQQVPLVGVASGGLAALAQFALSKQLRAKAPNLAAQLPGYLVHHLIASIFMLFAVTVGGSVWLAAAPWSTSAASRVLDTSGTVRFLAAAIFGELLLWDLPTAAFVKKLRRPDMIVHHVAMLVVAGLVVARPIFYGAFYLGFVELSVIPMLVNEVFAALHDDAEESGFPHDRSPPQAALPASRLSLYAKWRDVAQALAAISFVGVRGFDFTRVTLTRFIPEALSVLGVTSLAPSAVTKGTLYAMIGFTLSFNALQLYWLSLLIAYTLKEGFGGKRPE